MAISLLFFYGIIQLALIAYTFTVTPRQHWRLWFLRALLFGMAYDNIMQASGAWFINQDWYYPASVLRFVFHVLILPFLTIYTLSILKEAKISLADHKLFVGFCWLFTFGALAFGINAELIGISLEETEYFGIHKMVKVDNHPPFATIITNLLTIILAVYLWVKSGWKWLALGSIFIFVVNGATAPFAWSGFAGNFAEIVFVLALLATHKHFHSPSQAPL